MTTFAEYVAQWDDLCRKKAAIEEQLKPLAAQELAMRKALADSVKTALGAKLKEGVNTFPLGDGRSLKLTHSVKRDIEPGEIANARAKYDELNDRDLTFDQLLRIKHELDKTNWKKLTPAQRKAVSRMIVAKDATPTLEIV